MNVSQEKALKNLHDIKKEGQDQKLLFKKVGNNCTSCPADTSLANGLVQSLYENRIFHAVEPGTTNLAEFSKSS